MTWAGMWIGLGLGGGGSGRGHHLCLGEFELVLLPAEEISTAETDWPSWPGKSRGPQWEEVWESFIPLQDQRHPAHLHLPWAFLCSCHKTLCKRKTQKRWRKAYVCWLPIHLPQLPLCMTQSSCIRQFHLFLIYVFLFLHPSWGCI